MKKFSCFLCEKHFFDEKEIIKHLKIMHNIKDGTTNLKCAVSNQCSATYTSFKYFKDHISKCNYSVQVGKYLD